MNQLTHENFTRPTPATVMPHVERYLDNNGPGLDALLRQARAKPEVDEAERLRDLASSVQNADDAKKLVIRIRSCLDELLCAIGEPLAKIEAAYSAPDFIHALCWNAARLTDIERDIKFAFRI